MPGTKNQIFTFRHTCKASIWSLGAIMAKKTLWFPWRSPSTNRSKKMACFWKKQNWSLVQQIRVRSWSKVVSWSFVGEEKRFSLPIFRFSSHLTFNVDETMLEFSPSKNLRVITPKSIEKPALVVQNALTMHITMVMAICADGTHLQPLCILPLKIFPSELESVAGSFSWAGQSAGWITSKIFCDWVVKIFLPHVEAKRQEENLTDAPALLYIDGHASRESVEAIEALQEANVTMVCLPSHTSHLLQPLDRGGGGGGWMGYLKWQWSLFEVLWTHYRKQICERDSWRRLSMDFTWLSHANPFWVLGAVLVCPHGTRVE